MSYRQIWIPGVSFLSLLFFASAGEASFVNFAVHSNLNVLEVHQSQYAVHEPGGERERFSSVGANL